MFQFNKAILSFNLVHQQDMLCLFTAQKHRHSRFTVPGLQFLLYLYTGKIQPIPTVHLTQQQHITTLQHILHTQDRFLRAWHMALKDN
jgi:hypothetical protein